MKEKAMSNRTAFERDGFLILRAFFPPAQIAAVVPEAERLLGLTSIIQERNLRCRWQTHHITGALAFETFDPVVDISPICLDLALAPALLALLGDLYGDRACLFKDKLIFKPPGVHGYGLHQDWIAWPGFPKSFLTVLIPLDAADESNGCTIAYSGYHHRGSLSAEDGTYHELPAELVDEKRAVPLLLQPGDIAVFGGFTPHRSAPNRSQSWRRQLYLSYNKASDGGQQRARHYQEFHAWLQARHRKNNQFDFYFQ